MISVKAWREGLAEEFVLKGRRARTRQKGQAIFYPGFLEVKDGDVGPGNQQ